MSDLRRLNTRRITEILGELLKNNTILDFAIKMVKEGMSIEELTPILVFKIAKEEKGALLLGSILLNPEVFPNTTKEEMEKIFIKLNEFNLAEKEQAIRILYPVIFTVLSNEKWQNTGVIMTTEEKLVIEYIAGKWTANPCTGYATASGTPNLKAKYGYTLPDANEGALIGKISEKGTAFLVGEFVEVKNSVETGELFLCINDDLDCCYGNGVTDNLGSIEVSIASVLKD